MQFWSDKVMKKEKIDYIAILKGIPGFDVLEPEQLKAEITIACPYYLYVLASFSSIKWGEEKNVYFDKDSYILRL